MSTLRWLAKALLVLAVPLFLVTASVTWAVNDLRLYRNGFEKYEVSAVTGITDADLMRVAGELRRYFDSRREPLSVRIPIYGVERELFNQREVLHMRDVKSLVWGVYGVAAASGAYILLSLLFATAGAVLERRDSLRPVARRLLWGSGLTAAFLALVGLASLVSFDSVFLLFHKLSFANEFWQLDCPGDYLICMFPGGFWVDATLSVGLRAFGAAVALGALAGLALLWLPRGGGKRSARRRVPPRPASAKRPASARRGRR